MISRPVIIFMIVKLMECSDEVETCGTKLKCLKAWMSCHRGWWCFVSFLPPRCEFFLLNQDRACFHRWGYGPLTSRLNCAGVSKGPLVCAFHLRVSCRLDEGAMTTVVFRMWRWGQGVEIGTQLVLSSR